MVVGPFEAVRVIARFEDYAGRFPYHCHILEHEDHAMMRQFETVPAGTDASPQTSVSPGPEPTPLHAPQAIAALKAGKHVICEKPVAYDFHDTRRAAALAREKGLKTKLGFTFRYAPAMRYMRRLVEGGFIGQPFIFNGFEQNSQWLDPQTPLRQANHLADQSVLQVSSLEGYGAPIIDIAHLIVGADLPTMVIILVMMVIFLILGMLMDWVGIVLLVMPVFLPIVLKLRNEPPPRGFLIFAIAVAVLPLGMAVAQWLAA